MSPQTVLEPRPLRDLLLKIALFACAALLLALGALVLLGHPEERLSSSKYISTLTADRYQPEVLNHKGPVVVDFGAAWCGACTALSPILDDIAKEYAGRVKFVEMDVDYNRETAVELKIDELPCLILFKDGKEIARRTGLDSAKILKDWIDSSMKTQ